MLNKSIAYRLTLFVSLAVISVFVLFIVLNYLFNRNLLREKTEIQAINMSSEVNMLVNNYTVGTKNAAKNIAEEIIHLSNSDNVEILLSLTIRNSAYLDVIHIIADSSAQLKYSHYYIINYGNGELKYGNNNEPEFFCSNAKKLYEDFLCTDETGWTEPYRCPETGIIAVSYFTPFYIKNSDKKNVYAGHVICELSLTELNNAINQTNTGKRVFAFLTNQKGDYITYPNPDFILNQNIFLLPEKVINQKKIKIQQIVNNRLTGSAIVFPQILNFEKSWVYYTPTNENRWFLIFVIPFKELFGELNKMTLNMAFIVMAGVLILFVIIFFITRKLIKPLSAVTSSLSLFNESSENNTVNEVQIVSNTLDYLKEWFAQYKIVSQNEEMKSLRYKQDLQQASEIQRGLIKTVFPAYPERSDFDLFALYKPAGIVSGDLFDFFLVDDDNLVFTIGDVSGKGVPSAIFMSVAQTVIRNKGILKKANEIVEKTNIELSTNNHHQFFLTLFLGVLNLKTGILSYCNAAHDVPLILKPDGTIYELDKMHGLPLGLFSDKEYTTSSLKLNQGDTIVLYTDGVTELTNEHKEQFGTERLKNYLSQMAGLSPAEIIKETEKRMNFFRNGYPQSDDICLFTIKYFV